MRALSAVLLILIVTSALPSLATDAGRCVEVNVPAVESQGGRGSVVGVKICVSPGNNDLRIYGVDRIETDTLISIVAAYIIAQLLSNKPPTGYDIDITFERYVNDVSGPSAGALVAFAFYSLLSGSNASQSLSGTGAINLDGSVEAVGGIAQKLSALRASGYREVFLPVVNYVEYRQLFRDMRIIPIASITDLVNASIPSGSSGAGGYVANVILNVSKGHAVLMRGLFENLSKIYVERIRNTEDPGYRLAVGIVDMTNKNPPRDGYALINLYYLSITYLVQAIVDGDLDGYGRILIQRAVEEYNRSISRLAEAFSNIPRSSGVDKLLLYLVVFDRALDLAGYSDQVSAYLSSGSIGSIAGVAGSLYGRALSIEYWLDVLGNVTDDSGERVSLNEMYRASKSLLDVLRISSVPEEYTLNITRIIDGRADLEGLRMLSTAYALYSHLQNYSSIIRRSTLSQAAPLPGGELSYTALDQLRRSGYMIDTLGIMGSGVARSIYSFSLWALNNTDPRSQEARILFTSLITTSAAASSLNMIYMILSKRVHVPTRLEIRGEAENSFQGSAGEGAVNATYMDLETVSNILTLASIVIAIATLIYTILARSSLGQKNPV